MFLPFEMDITIFLKIKIFQINDHVLHFILDEFKLQRFLFTLLQGWDTYLVRSGNNRTLSSKVPLVFD